MQQMNVNAFGLEVIFKKSTGLFCAFGSLDEHAMPDLIWCFGQFADDCGC